MNIKIFCRCSLFPSWSGQRFISTPVLTPANYCILNNFGLSLSPPNSAGVSVPEAARSKA